MAGRYSGVDDFGLIKRGDDLSLCGASGAFNRAELCRVIDDAVLYFKTQNTQIVNDVFYRMGRPPPGVPDSKPGRINEFYRVIAAMRFAQQYGGRAMTLAEIMFVIEASGGESDRWDDFGNVSIFTKAVLGVRLTPEEAAVVAPYQTALQAAKTGQYDQVKPKPPTPTATAAKGGAAVPLALAAGGFLVGGPVGAGVGLVVGLAAGRKK